MQVKPPKLPYFQLKYSSFPSLHANLDIGGVTFQGELLGLFSAFFLPAGRIIWRAAAKVEGHGRGSFQQAVKPGFFFFYQALSITLDSIQRTEV